MTEPFTFDSPDTGAAAPRSSSETGVTGPHLLTVFVDPIAVEASRWDMLVADVGRVLGLAPSYLPIDMQDAGWVGRLLRAAVAAPGPVLVLPRVVPKDLEAVGAAHLLRVVIASGDAEDVVRSARFLSHHLRRGGVHTTVLVVLANGVLPSMWEGPGHHAAAWRNELRRRHGGPDRLEVLSGVPRPGTAIRQHAEDADLLILMWRRVIAEGRAAVVRTVLGEGSGLPCLLVPIAWLERLRDLSFGLPLPEREAIARG